MGQKKNVDIQVYMEEYERFLNWAWRSLKANNINFRKVYKICALIENERAGTAAESYLIEVLVPEVKNFAEKLFKARDIKENISSSPELVIENVKDAKDAFESMIVSFKVLSSINNRKFKNYGLLVRYSELCTLVKQGWRKD